MNVKFILFCIASLGCLMMMYLWFTMHKSVINSQLNEEQFLYRISSLKSEIDFEKRLIENLRKETKDYGQRYNEKSIVYEAIQKKSQSNDREKSKVEKQIEKLKSDYEELTKSSEKEIQDMKTKADDSKTADNNEIETLLSDVKKLEREHDELLAAQKKPDKKTAKPEVLGLNKPNEMLQGKPPKLNKMVAKNKESKRPKSQWYPAVPEPKVDKPLSNIENIKTPDGHNQNILSKSDTIISNTDLNTTPAENAEIKTDQLSQKTIFKNTDIRPKAPMNNVRDDISNDEFMSKDENFLKRPHNPKKLLKKDKTQDYHISKTNVKPIDISIKEDAEQQKSKDNMEGFHQLKPPRKEDYPKEKDHSRGNIAKLGHKNEVAGLLDRDI